MFRKNVIHHLKTAIDFDTLFHWKYNNGGVVYIEHRKLLHLNIYQS